LWMKLFVAGIVLPILMVLVLFGMYYKTAKENAVSNSVEKVRAIALTAESISLESQAMWEAGIYSMDKLQEWAKAGDMEKVLMVSPVVGAVQAVLKQAKEGAYKFKIASLDATLGKTEPDSVELRALNYMEQNDTDEYYEVDKRSNSVRFFKSIKIVDSCLTCHGSSPAANELWKNIHGNDIDAQNMQQWKAGEKHAAFEVIQSLDAADAQVASGVRMASLVVAFSVVVFGIIFWRTASGMLRPLDAVKNALTELSKGNLTQELTVARGDEIGQIASSVNETACQLNNIMRHLANSSQSLFVAMDEIYDHSSSNSLGAETMKENALQVAHSGEQLSSNISKVTSSARVISDTANRVASTIDRMNGMIDEIAKNCSEEERISQQANSQAKQTRLLMVKLGDSAREIGHVTEVIKSIADQTNLLALNAAIEAASAGDAGKGFAVVANEVKELARQSAKASEQISAQMNGVQKDVQVVIEAIESISVIINKVVSIATSVSEAVGKQSVATKEISTSISEVSRGTNDISLNIQEFARGADEVSQKIQTISTDAGLSANRAKEVSQYAKNLSACAKELQEVVGRFRLR